MFRVLQRVNHPVHAIYTPLVGKFTRPKCKILSLIFLTRSSLLWTFKGEFGQIISKCWFCAAYVLSPL
jgi:hypothetical protein